MARLFIVANLLVAFSTLAQELEKDTFICYKIGLCKQKKLFGVNRRWLLLALCTH